MTRTKALLLVQGLPVCVLCGGIGYAGYRLGYKKGLVSGFETGKKIGITEGQLDHLWKQLFGYNNTKKKEDEES